MKAKVVAVVKAVAANPAVRAAAKRLEVAVIAALVIALRAHGVG